jgi:hypothetical protein
VSIGVRPWFKGSIELSPGKMQWAVQFIHKNHEHKELHNDQAMGCSKNFPIDGGTDPCKNSPPKHQK